MVVGRNVALQSTMAEESTVSPLEEIKNKK